MEAFCKLCWVGGLDPASRPGSTVVAQSGLAFCFSWRVVVAALQVRSCWAQQFQDLIRCHSLSQAASKYT